MGICPQSLSVPRCEQFSESNDRGYCELRGTINIQGQIYEHTLRRNGGYCAPYPSISFDNVRLKSLRVSYCLCSLIVRLRVIPRRTVVGSGD